MSKYTPFWHFLELFFPDTSSPPFFPWERGEIWPFLGRLVFFAAVRPHGASTSCKNNEYLVWIYLEKRRKIQQKRRKTDRTPLRTRTKITTQTYGTEEVYMHILRALSSEKPALYLYEVYTWDVIICPFCGHYRAQACTR